MNATTRIEYNSRKNEVLAIRESGVNIFDPDFNDLYLEDFGHDLDDRILNLTNSIVIDPSRRESMKASLKSSEIIKKLSDFYILANLLRFTNHRSMFLDGYIHTSSRPLK